MVAFFVLTACLIIARLMFGYFCHGSLWNIYLFTALHITVMAGLGLLISNYSSNAQQAMFITWFFTMVFMLVSGIFTPIASMPRWAQAITWLNPMRYYNDAMRCVFLKGSTLTEVWYDALGLLAIGAATLTGCNPHLPQNHLILTPPAHLPPILVTKQVNCDFRKKMP